MVKTEDDVDRDGESVMHVFLYNGRDGTGAATSRKQLRLGLRAAVTAVIDSTCYLYSPTSTIHPLLFRLGSIRRSSNYLNIAFTYRVLLFFPSFNPRRRAMCNSFVCVCVCTWKSKFLQADCLRRKQLIVIEYEKSNIFVGKSD